jgi:hypothetical protein
MHLNGERQAILCCVASGRHTNVKDVLGWEYPGVAVWYTDIWPEMTLSFGSTPVCRAAQYPDALALGLTLSSGPDTCTLDSGTARCCNFSGVPYEVVCPDAWHSVSGARPDYAYFLVARQDVLVPAP